MKQSWFMFLSFMALTLIGCTQQQPRTSPANIPASDFGTSRAATATINTDGFDFFLLNLSWSPEYCHSHHTAPECAQHSAFVLHGLWPERKDGAYPENCSNSPGPAEPAQYSDIYPGSGLLKHEWRTHGTCSGMSPDAYFTAARTAYKSIAVPQKLTQLSQQISLAPDDLIELFRQSNPALPSSSIVISCGNNYLTAVEVCLDKSFHPVACGSLRTCHANSIRVPNP